MKGAADHYSRGLALLAVVGLVAAWPLIIGAALAQLLQWVAGWPGDASLEWCLLFAAPILPYAFGRAAPQLHRFTRPSR